MQFSNFVNYCILWFLRKNLEFADFLLDVNMNLNFFFLWNPKQKLLSILSKAWMLLLFSACGTWNSVAFISLYERITILAFFWKFTETLGAAFEEETCFCTHGMKFLIRHHYMDSPGQWSMNWSVSGIGRSWLPICALEKINGDGSQIAPQTLLNKEYF